MDGIWEPLAELEFNLHGNKKYPVHCLCSRAFIRSKSEVDNWGDVKDSEKYEPVTSEPLKSSQDSDGQMLDIPNKKKQEVEIVSCYCSASHYSTDDYESVMQSTSDHCQTTVSKEQPVLYPLQNSDSGADLSENFIDKPCRVNEESQCSIDVDGAILKSKLDIAWEKYWSTNGENIIWKSWIEKYGAYINPTYLEQNNLNDLYDMEIDDLPKEASTSSPLPNVNAECITESSGIDGKGESTEMPCETKEYAINDNPDRIPDLKISSYLSCSNLSEAEDTIQPNINCLELDPEDNLLKSNSFGSYETYEKEKHGNTDEEQFKSYEHERVRSRCSNTNLSVKSIANTTVTTDSMTNVTKITLSSLDLSGECESMHSSSLSSTCTDDSSEITSSSTSSSKEEMCTEADAWWRKLWKEHYEEQYSSSFTLFSEDFKIKNESLGHKEDVPVRKNTNELGSVSCRNSRRRDRKAEAAKAVKEKKEKKENVFESREYLNSVSHLLHRLENTNLKVEKDVSLDRSVASETNAMNVSTEDTNKESGAMACDLPNTAVPVESGKRQLPASEDDLEESEDDADVMDGRHLKRFSQKRSSQRDLNEGENRSGKKLDNIKQAMSLIGLSYRFNSDVLKSGYVTFRKKNIRGQNRRLIFSDAKPSSHIFFDDDGNEMYESKHVESLDTPESPEEEASSKTEAEEMNRLKQCFIEKESLGYEAHSSSVDEEVKIIDENKKQKKKRKRQRKCNNIPFEVEENKNLIKYWIKRYQLFSKFDAGIKLDAESWYSVTPEKVAMHHAQRCRCDIIIDAFCGAGGNSIQFAFTCERVIAIDIDPKKIEIAKNNARVYGVEDRIEFIVGDFTKLAIKLQGDVVFLSPPWGGPEYSSHDVYNLENILPPLGGVGLFDLANGITTEVAYFLPKNVNSTELAILPGPGGQVEIEQDFLGRKLTSVTAYFGELIRDPDDPFLDVA